MTDVVESAQEADQEDVRTEAEQVEAPEAVDSTEGQVEDQPAEDDGEEPKAKEEVSPSKARRERRKAEMERAFREKTETAEKLAQAEARLKRFEEAASKAQPPKEKDFASYDEYQASLSAYHSLKALDDRQRQEAMDEAKGHRETLSAKEQARQTELYANWQDQVAEAGHKYADFAQVFTDDVPITQEAAELIAGSDAGIDIAYYLGTNRQEAAQIAQLTPLEQARRIGAIEARLSLPRANTTPSAPDPITPLKGGGGAPKDPTKMSPDQYRAWRESGGKF